MIIIGIYTFVKYERINSIITNFYSKIESMRELENYILTKETKYINFENNETENLKEEYYYKDGKYKTVSGERIEYLEDDSYNKIFVFNDLKQIDYYEQNFIEYKKGKNFDIFSEIISYKKELKGAFKLLLSIKEGRFNGIDCYIIRMGDNNSHRDVWINKNNYITLRVIDEEYSKYYREEVYTLMENVVKDELVDSSILDSEVFKNYQRNKITYNATKEITEFFE